MVGSGDSPLVTEPSATYNVIKIEPEDVGAVPDCPMVAAEDGCLPTASSSSPSPACSIATQSTESADENYDDEIIDTSTTALAETIEGCVNDEQPSTAGVVATTDPGVICLKGRVGAGEKSECRVCGDEASGMYFGAFVCVPCKTFFLRYAGEGRKFTCRYWRSCDVTVSTRTQCKSCRYQKCIRVGMRRRVRPIHVQIGEGQQLCAVCSDVGNGIHFGVITCEGCKKFFRRGLVENSSYRCKNGGQCAINPQTRNLCRYCRFWKCIGVGMSRNAIQMGRPTKCFQSTSDVGQQQQRSLRPAVSEPITQSAAVPSNPGLAADVAVFNWLQTNKVPTVMNLAPGTSGQAPNFQAQMPNMPACQAWIHNLQNCNLLFALQNGFTFPGVRVDQPDDLSIARPADQMPCEIGNVVRGEARNQSVSPDSTVKEEEIRKPHLLQNTVADKEESRGSGANRVDELLLNARKRTVSSHGGSGPSESRLPVDDAVAPARKFQVVDDGLNLELQRNNSVGLDLRRYSSLQDSSTNIEQVTLTKPAAFAENGVSEEENYSGHSHGGRIGKACRRLSQRPTELPAAKTVIDIAVPKTENAEDVPHDTSSLDLMSLTSLSYWLKPRREVGQMLAVGQQHWNVVNGIIPAYDRFVHQGDCLNRILKTDYEEWSQNHVGGQLSSWIKSKVIPAYTVASVNYCKSLPGFQSFDADDQVTIIRLGQSSSRILLAAVHWFDTDDKIFRNFLSWRSSSGSRSHSDMFKQMLVEYAEKISSLEPDPIEAALLNVLLIFATDYPNLKQAAVIEETRSKIIATLHAYTSAKFGTPVNRVGQLCSMAPEARRLGLLHYQMTKTRTMTLEEVGQPAVK